MQKSPLTHLRVPADVVDFRAAVDRKIVMDRVVARAIVIVDRSAVGIAVRDNKVVMYMRHGRNKRRLPSRDRRDKRLPVPAINRAVVTLQQIGLFLEFSLCLSRACLGKMFVFTYRWLKRWRFSHRFSAGLKEKVLTGRKRHFFEFFLCLSRACLGKMMIFRIKWQGESNGRDKSGQKVPFSHLMSFPPPKPARIRRPFFKHKNVPHVCVCPEPVLAYHNHNNLDIVLPRPVRNVQKTEVCSFYRVNGYHHTG